MYGRCEIGFPWKTATVFVRGTTQRKACSEKTWGSMYERQGEVNRKPVRKVSVNASLGVMIRD
jgi:hypothetical protein